VKRRDLLRHLDGFGCRPLREGARYTVWFNPVNGRLSTIPRHRELNDFLAHKICHDLGVPTP
jgi:hypothetical protein